MLGLGYLRGLRPEVRFYYLSVQQIVGFPACFGLMLCQKYSMLAEVVANRPHPE